MNSMHLWLVFTFLSYSAADHCKEVCLLDDITCVSHGGSLTYKSVVNGSHGLVKPMDPLHIKKISKKTESTKHELTDITLIGLRNCEVTLLMLNVTASVYKQYVYCPKLISTFHYKVKESSESLDYEKEGTATVTTYNRKILNKGKYGVLVREEDHNPHFFVLTHTLNTEVKGNLEFKLKDDCNSDKHKCKRNKANKTERYMKKYWLETEDPIIKRAMKILVARIDTYCRALTMGDILPEIKKKKCSEY